MTLILHRYCEDTHSQVCTLQSFPLPFFTPFLPLLHLSLQFASYTYQVSGTGLHSATANHPTHVLVELSDSSGRPCSLQQNVTAELELISKATPTSPSCKTCLLVAMMSPSQYKVSYTAVSRGQHKLHVQVNNREINGSPFTITVYPDPTQLGCPVRVVTGLNHPYGIAFNSRGEMIISESNGHQISIFDIRGKKIRPFGSHGDSPEQMIQPRGIAIDDANNIYVSSEHKLQKFTSSGELIMCVGQKGNKEGAEFYYPRGVTLHNNQLYVCDRDNHRIQVFDLDLNFIQPISVCGRGGDKVKDPYDVKFDSAGNMYIADYGNERVQVMDINGRFIRAFGQEGKEKLKGPSAVHIVGTYVYVPDHSGLCIVVYDTSGQFVTSFGERGNKEGQFRYPRCITSCADGFIYVCDSGNGRVQIF